MKPVNKYDRLLDAIFRDEKLMAFENALLDRCFQELKQRRRIRFRFYTLGAVAAILLMVLLIHLGSKVYHPELSDVYNVRPSYIVSTTPLSGNERVRTSHEALTGLVVHTQPEPSMMYSGKTCEVVRLSNAEMLDLFHGIPCGILRMRNRTSKLIFFRPEDEKRFMARGIEGG